MADEEEQDVGPKTRTGAEQAAALDRVTDRVSIPFKFYTFWN
jgi:hypothetical protein